MHGSPFDTLMFMNCMIQHCFSKFCIRYSGTDMALPEELMWLSIILSDFSLIYSLSVKGQDAQSPNTAAYLKKIEKKNGAPAYHSVCLSVCLSLSALTLNYQSKVIVCVSVISGCSRSAYFNGSSIMDTWHWSPSFGRMEERLTGCKTGCSAQNRNLFYYELEEKK